MKDARPAVAAGGPRASTSSQVLEENHIQPAGEDGGYFQSFGNGYRNVLGMIPGRDPQLKHECIVIGGHYDHVGYGTPRNSFGPTGSIHNGADDNASGTAGRAGNHAGVLGAPRTASPLRAVRVLGRRRKRSARLKTLGNLSHGTAQERRVRVQRRHDRPTPR